jgi:hypothetical protein
LAAEPLAGGLAGRPTAAAFDARLAREAGVGADRADADTRVARPAAAADATADRAERDIGARQEEPGPERARTEQLEELTARRALGQLAGDCSGEIHRYEGDAG